MKEAIDAVWAMPADTLVFYLIGLVGGIIVAKVMVAGVALWWLNRSAKRQMEDFRRRHRFL